jgi:magnesium transporter
MTDPIEYYREYRSILDNSQVRELFSEISFDQLLGEWRGLSEEEAADIFLHLSPEVKLDLITELEPDDQEKIIRRLSAKGKRTLFQSMEPDDLVDIVQSVSQEVRRTVWESLDDESKKETLFLLRFDEDDAAGLMTPRYLAIRSDMATPSLLYGKTAPRWSCSRRSMFWTSSSAWKESPRSRTFSPRTIICASRK